MNPFLSRPLSPITSPDQKPSFDDVIYEKLIRNEAAFIGEEGLVLVSDEVNYLRPLIDQYVLDICSSIAVAWKYVDDARHAFLQPLYLSRYSGLLHVLGECMALDRLDRTCRPSLRNEILYEAMRELNFQTVHGAEPMALSAEPDWQNWEFENRLLQKVRELAQGRGFQRSDYEVWRAHEENCAAGKRFLDAAFEARSRIEVARIDLYYRKPFQAELTISQVQADFRRLWENRKRKAVFKGLMGYIWGLEYTDAARFHFHVILIFKGSDVNKSFGRALGIKEYWENDITAGRGYAHVCEASDYRLDQVYLGEVEAHQMEKRALLLAKGVGYLAKREQLLPIRLARIRAFGTSALPKRVSNAGRPRLPLEKRKLRESSRLFPIRVPIEAPQPSVSC